MNKKFFISAFYSGINIPLESFRPSDLYFKDIDSCVRWIDSHKKYFSPDIHFGICSLDNSFTI